MKSRCSHVQQRSNPLSPWRVLTAISGMGAVRLGGGKREQVIPKSTFHWDKGVGGCPSAPRPSESPC